MAKMKASISFTAYVPHVLAGLIACEESEVQGIAHFTFIPGRAGTRAHPLDRFAEPDDAPEVEITKIEIFGHADKEPGTKPEYRELPGTDPHWDAIHDYVMDHCRDEMAEAAVDTDNAARDDAMERRAEERRLSAAE